MAMLGGLSGHVTGERLGIKDREGATAQRGREATVDLNGVLQAAVQAAATNFC